MQPLDTAHITVQLKNFYTSKGNNQLTAKNINYGYCFNWAYLAYKNIPGAVLCSIRDYTYRHAFIEVDGKYYDSMTRKGVTDWTQLKSIKHDKGTKGMVCDEMTEYAFVTHWEKNGIAPFVDVHKALSRTTATMHNVLEAYTEPKERPTQTLTGLLRKARASKI